MPTVKELRDFCRLTGIPCSGTKPALTATVQQYPHTYMSGLDPEEAFEKTFTLRSNELRERNEGFQSFERLSSDARQPVKTSTYTTLWLSMYPHATTLESQSRVSGVPTDILERVYRKGLAAWRGGHHRPGASQHAWAMARVYSFLTKGKTFFTADGKLAEEAVERSLKARQFWGM